MFLPSSSFSFNLSSIEKKLAAIESSNISAPPTVVKSTGSRLPKVTNENELDAFLRSERSMFNDEQFDRLTQEVNMNVDEKRIGSLLRFLFQSR